MEEIKKPWESKTVWANAIIGVAPLIPGASGWIAENPQGFGVAVGLLNVVLRFITTKKLSFDWKF